MFRKLTIPSFLLCLLLLLGACYTNQLTLSILEPATIGLPASIKRISILPIPGVPSKTGEFDSLRYIVPKSNDNIVKIKMGYLHGIYDVFSSSPHFQKVVFSDSAISSFAASGRLYWNDLVRLCAHDTTDVVLVLSKALSHDFYDYLSGSNGLDYFNSGYTLKTETRWVFYLPVMQKELVKHTLKDTMMMTGGFSLLEFDNLLYDACYSIGRSAGYRFVPHWHDVNRVYFTGPGRNMKKAEEYIRKDHWNDAAAIWNPIAESPNKNLASRAAQNLALAYERDDELDQAILWITYADSLHHNVLSESYKKILEERIKNMEKLDGQMAGN